MSSRGGADGGSGEHEGSRRMKTELLIQMDGLSRGTEHVFVLAASNLPWDLDPALLRRLEKRVIVPLPDKIARKKMLESHLVKQTNIEGDSDNNNNENDKEIALSSSQLDLDKCAEETEGYSGADIKLLCKGRLSSPLRLFFW